MPTCKTCRGEYTAEEYLCPACGKKLGRSLDRCRRCGAQTGGQRLCPRCRSDVGAWERESLSLLEFIAIRGGFAGLLPAVVAACVWLLVFWRAEDSLHHPIASIASIALSLLVLLALFFQHDSLRERGWASQVYRVSPVLSWIGAGSIPVGILSTLIAFTLYKTWETPTHFLQKLLFAGVYSLVYVSFTAGLTFMVLQAYVSKLNQRVPQPIFVHTGRLLEIVLQDAYEDLKDRKAPEENRQSVQADGEKHRSFEVVRVTRNRDDGSIQAVVRECKFVWRVDQGRSFKDKWKEETWIIDADKWGRIRSLEPEYPPQAAVDEYLTHRALMP